MLIAIIGNSAQSLLSFRGTLILELVRRGHRVDAYAPDYSSKSADAVAALGARPISFRLQRSGTNPLADVKTALELIGLLRQHRPDATLCYFIKPAIYGSIAASLCRIPRRLVLLEGLGYGFATDVKKQGRHRIIAGIMKRLMRSTLSTADRIMVLNADDRAVLIDDLRLEPAKIDTIGGIGVELDRYQPGPVNEHAQVFALAARMIAEKGVCEYVEAAREIRKRHPDVVFLLLGEVDDNPGSLDKTQLTRWVDEGVIVWPGRVDDIQTWLNKCDVFVLPSYYREGVPRSIQEAMALGRAIITTDHVGCRDTVVPGENGFLIAIRNIQQLADAMEQLILRPGLAQRMGRESRRLAEQRFDARRVDRLIASYFETSEHPQMPAAT